jgi:hypothetical protein
MASFHKSTSYLVNTPVKDFYLDLWEADEVDVLPNITDEKYTIESLYNERPDLLAFDKYGNAKLWWVIILRNKDVLFDPIADFRSGVQIWLPSADSVRGKV